MARTVARAQQLRHVAAPLPLLWIALLGEANRYLTMMPVPELIDKEPTLGTIWGAAVALGLLGFAATRFRRWLVIPALALIAIVAWSQLGALVDPSAAPAIIQEAGRGYLIQSCAAVALAVVLSVLGLVPKRSP
jgi:hypothetical protein